MAAFGFGLIGFVLWLLSYVWILFRFAGRETDAVWSFVLSVEIGAMAAGLISIASGLIAGRFIETDGTYSRRARHGAKLGAAVWVCIVLFNLMGIFFFS
ncbi:MAG TPA: hypothetical protein VF692_02390 [Pyrinomonadaceae bacterium]|jgi:hypothetical protein